MVGTKGQVDATRSAYAPALEGEPILPAAFIGLWSVRQYLECCIRLSRHQHNVKRVRYSKEALESKKQREQSKLKEYLALTNDLIIRVSFTLPLDVDLCSTMQNRRRTETSVKKHSI